MKARLEKLARIPGQNDEGGGGERVQQIAGPFQRPAAEDDGHHHGRTDGGRFPAGRRRVKPDGRNRDGSAPRPRKPQHAEERDNHAGQKRDAESVNREHVHRAGAEKGFADVAGEGGAPAERHS